MSNKSHLLHKVILCLFVFTLIHIPGASADIYKWVDENGVVHFTNIPTKSNYEVFVRDNEVSSRFDPDRYDQIIREASNKYMLEFELIKAVINVESNFNSRAVSPAGAKGLMQIMPANFTEFGISDPFDPKQNIHGGVRYLEKLLKRYDGSLSLALAAYNAGPSTVGDSIPEFGETQQYVMKVMDKYYQYRKGAGSRAVWQWAEEEKEEIITVPPTGKKDLPTSISKIFDDINEKDSKSSDTKDKDRENKNGNIKTEKTKNDSAETVPDYLGTPDPNRQTISIRFSD